MDIREEILGKYKELNNFLENVDITELQKTFSRAELNAFKDTLYQTKLRNLAFEIGKMTEEMKKNEFPQLKGVHHFPILNQIDFLSDKQKIQLDKSFSKYRPGSHVDNLWEISNKPDIIIRLEAWLQDEGIIQKQHIVMCPNCLSESISRPLEPTEKTKLENELASYHEEQDYDYEFLKDILHGSCWNCHDFPPLEEIKKLTFKEVYIMLKERDNSLDNI